MKWFALWMNIVFYPQYCRRVSLGNGKWKWEPLP